MARSPVTRQGQALSDKYHESLQYLDLQHQLCRVGYEIQGTVTDLRNHLLDHHGTAGASSGRTGKTYLARLHLTMHAVGAMFK